MAFVTLGTFMLWFGWFGFNSGSVYVYSTVAPAAAVQIVAMNTTLAASSAGLASLLLACFWTGERQGVSQCMMLKGVCAAQHVIALIFDRGVTQWTHCKLG
jgi:ammonia channel protein AmtB